MYLGYVVYMAPRLFGIDFYLVSTDRLIKALQSLPSGCSVCGGPINGVLCIYFYGHQVGTISIRANAIVVEYSSVEFIDNRDDSVHVLDGDRQEF